jgi:spermidine synthase
MLPLEGDMAAPAETIDKQVTEDGTLLELRRRGEALEVLLDGRRVMASDARRSETSLVELALAPLSGRDDITILLAGLGMGFTLRAALDAPGVKRVDVVEGARAIVDWEARHFAALNGDVLKDGRVKLHQQELGAFLKQIRIAGPQSIGPGAPEDGWLALVLDLDEGPETVARASNRGFYTDEGIERLEAALRPGGVLAMWSPQREPELVRRLHARLQNVAEVVVPVELDGKSSLDYVYRGRRPPNPVEPAKAPN